MKQNFTPNHLLLAAYGELSPNATAELQQAVFSNEVLNNSLQVIIDWQIALDALSLQPSKTSLAIILEHSRESEVTA